MQAPKRDAIQADSPIQHVSDTALLVAAGRAIETERPDALIRDPFALKLAGGRGMRIARGLAGAHFMAFGIAMRVRFMDEILEDLVARGEVNTILNLGAGLDARPYRLRLPSDLRWMEADLAGMIEHKTRALADEAPRCRVERTAADVTILETRNALFNEAVREGGRVALLTEGLLMYLPEAAVQGIARDAHAIGFRYWLLDIASAEMMKRAHGISLDSIERVRAPGHLDGRQILETGQKSGWVEVVHRSYIREGAALAGRRFEGMPQPEPGATPPAGDPSGVWLLRRT